MSIARMLLVFGVVPLASSFAFALTMPREAGAQTRSDAADSAWPIEVSLECTFQHGVETTYADTWRTPRAVAPEMNPRSPFTAIVSFGSGFQWSLGGGRRGEHRIEGHRNHIFISIRDAAPALAEDPTSTFTYRAGPNDLGGPYQLIWNEAGYVTASFGQCARTDL